jgi:tetratricopeptide (TPR) repeat protein
MDAAREVTTLRKAGRLDEALELVKPALAEAPDDLWLRRTAGWVFYDLIKREVTGFQEGHVPRGQLIAHLDAWLREYARGGKGDCPGLLHSLLLTQVLKVSKEWPRFLAFARWWDPSLLRPEDREPYQLDTGKAMASLELRLIYAVGRAVASGWDGQSPDLVAWGADLVAAALAAQPNDQWLHYYKSKHLIGLGQTSEARGHLLPVLRRQRQASWAWALFARAWARDDPGKAITCYFRALQVARKGLEVVGVRADLAALLVKADRFAEAAVQVRVALQCREQNGFRIPQDLAGLAASDWYKRYSDLPNVTREPDVAQEAHELLFGAHATDLVFRPGVIDNQNDAKALAHVAFGPDDGAILLYRSMKGIAELPVGTCVEVGFVDGDDRPVAYRLSDKTEIPGVYEHFTGELSQREGWAFAFVITDDGERIFVPPSLIRGLDGLLGATVACAAARGKDKQGRRGWRAVSIGQPAAAAERRPGNGLGGGMEPRAVTEG